MDKECITNENYWKERRMWINANCAKCSEYKHCQLIFLYRMARSLRFIDSDNKSINQKTVAPTSRIERDILYKIECDKK